MLVRSCLPTILFLTAASVAVYGQHAGKMHDDPTGFYPEGFDRAQTVSERLDRAKQAVDAEIATSGGFEVQLVWNATTSPDAYLLLTQLSQFWDTGANDWTNENLVTYTRDDAGAQTELLIQDWDAGSSSWVNSNRRVFNVSDGMTETLDEDWDPDANAGQGDWAPLQRRTSQLDDLGRILVSATEIWDEDAGEYMIFNRSTNTYEGSNTRPTTTMFESISFITGTFGPSLRYTFTYTDDGETASRLHESYNRTAEQFERAGLKEWSYDSNGAETLDLELDWDDAAGDWVNSYRTATVYEPNSSNPTSVTETEQSWDEAAGAWVNEERVIASISGSDITETEQEWDPSAGGGAGDWVNVDQSITTIQGGQPVAVVTQEWDAGQGAWVNVDRSTVEIDDRGLIVSNLQEVWDGSDWENDFLLTMTYGEFETPTATDTEEIASGYELGAGYPNPFSESTTIRFTLPEPAHVTLEVFDMLGRRVQTLVATTLSTGDHSVTMEARDLPGGLYLVQLESERFQASKSLFLIK